MDFENTNDEEYEEDEHMAYVHLDQLRSDFKPKSYFYHSQYIFTIIPDFENALRRVLEFYIQYEYIPVYWFTEFNKNGLNLDDFSELTLIPYCEDENFISDFRVQRIKKRTPKQYGKLHDEITITNAMTSIESFLLLDVQSQNYVLEKLAGPTSKKLGSQYLFYNKTLNLELCSISILPILNSTQEKKIQHIGEYFMFEDKLHSMDDCFSLLISSIPEKEYFLFGKKVPLSKYEKYIFAVLKKEEITCTDVFGKDISSEDFDRYCLVYNKIINHTKLTPEEADFIQNVFDVNKSFFYDEIIDINEKLKKQNEQYEKWHGQYLDLIASGAEITNPPKITIPPLKFNMLEEEFSIYDPAQKLINKLGDNFAVSELKIYKYPSYRLGDLYSKEYFAKVPISLKTVEKPSSMPIHGNLTIKNKLLLDRWYIESDFQTDFSKAFFPSEKTIPETNQRYYNKNILDKLDDVFVCYYLSKLSGVAGVSADELMKKIDTLEFLPSDVAIKMKITTYDSILVILNIIFLNVPDNDSITTDIIKYPYNIIKHLLNAWKNYSFLFTEDEITRIINAIDPLPTEEQIRQIKLAGFVRQGPYWYKNNAISDSANAVVLAKIILEHIDVTLPDLGKLAKLNGYKLYGTTWLKAPWSGSVEEVKNNLISIFRREASPLPVLRTSVPSAPVNKSLSFRFYPNENLVVSEDGMRAECRTIATQVPINAYFGRGLYKWSFNIMNENARIGVIDNHGVIVEFERVFPGNVHLTTDMERLCLSSQTNAEVCIDFENFGEYLSPYIILKPGGSIEIVPSRNAVVSDLHIGIVNVRWDDIKYNVAIKEEVLHFSKNQYAHVSCPDIKLTTGDMILYKKQDENGKRTRVFVDHASSPKPAPPEPSPPEPAPPAPLPASDQKIGTITSFVPPGYYKPVLGRTYVNIIDDLGHIASVNCPDPNDLKIGQQITYKIDEDGGYIFVPPVPPVPKPPAPVPPAPVPPLPKPAPKMYGLVTINLFNQKYRVQVDNDSGKESFVTVNSDVPLNVGDRIEYTNDDKISYLLKFVRKL